MSIEFTPVGDRILVLPAEAERQTAAGILIPDSAQEKSTRGVVVKVAGGNYSDNGSLIPINSAIKEGATVVYGKWGGTELELEGQAYVILKESDIYGVIA